jgi:hypothetical protein
MDLSHDILTQIGWEVEVARKKKAVLAELTNAHRYSEESRHINDFYDLFQSDEWIDFFYAGLSLEEWRWDDYIAVDEDNSGTDCFERIEDYPTIEPFYIKWQDASEYRAMGKLVIVE